MQMTSWGNNFASPSSAGSHPHHRYSLSRFCKGRLALIDWQTRITIDIMHVLYHSAQSGSQPVTSSWRPAGLDTVYATVRRVAPRACFIPLVPSPISKSTHQPATSTPRAHPCQRTPIRRHALRHDPHHSPIRDTRQCRPRIRSATCPGQCRVHVGSRRHHG